MLIAIAVFSALQCLTAVVKTQPMLSTTSHVRRGQRLTAGMVEVIDVPAHTSFAHAPAEPGQIESRIALVDMPAGTLVLRSHIRGAPVAPEGTTVIEARLASRPEGVDAGDEIDLIVGQPCRTIMPPDGDGTANGNGTTNGNDMVDTPGAAHTDTPMPVPTDVPTDAASEQTGQDTAPEHRDRQCTIASKATLIAFNERADGTTADSASIAMRPGEALTVMSLPDSLPVIAARREGT